MSIFVLGFLSLLFLLPNCFFSDWCARDLSAFGYWKLTPSEAIFKLRDRHSFTTYYITDSHYSEQYIYILDMNESLSLCFWWCTMKAIASHKYSHRHVFPYLYQTELSWWVSKEAVKTNRNRSHLYMCHTRCKRLALLTGALLMSLTNDQHRPTRLWRNTST